MPLDCAQDVISQLVWQVELTSTTYMLMSHLYARHQTFFWHSTERGCSIVLGVKIVNLVDAVLSLVLYITHSQWT